MPRHVRADVQIVLDRALRRLLFMGWLLSPRQGLQGQVLLEVLGRIVGRSSYQRARCVALIAGNGGTDRIWQASAKGDNSIRPRG